MQVLQTGGAHKWGVAEMLGEEGVGGAGGVGHTFDMKWMLALKNLSRRGRLGVYKQDIT